MRQRDPRERQLLAHVRRGDPSDYIADKDSRGQLQVFAGDVDAASCRRARGDRRVA